MSGSTLSAVPVSTVSPIVHAIGGVIDLASALLLFYPLERARIKMQSNTASGKRLDEQHGLIVPAVAVKEATKPYREDQ